FAEYSISLSNNEVLLASNTAGLSFCNNRLALLRRIREKREKIVEEILGQLVPIRTFKSLDIKSSNKSDKVIESIKEEFLQFSSHAATETELEKALEER